MSDSPTGRKQDSRGAFASVDDVMLQSIDTNAPFVTYTLDTARINVAFQTIIQALTQVKLSVTDLQGTVKDHDKSIGKLREDLDALKLAHETDPRFDELRQIGNKNSERIQKLDDRINALSSRIDRNEQRLSSQEAKSVDLTPLEAAVTQLRSDAKAQQQRTSDLADECGGNRSRIQQNADRIAEAAEQSTKLDGRVSAIYNILEMNEAVVRSLVNDPSNSRRSGKPVKALTEYVLGLPSFASLRGDLDGAIAKVDAEAKEGVFELKKRITEDVTTLKMRLGDKLDVKTFNTFKTETTEALRKYAALPAKVEQLTVALDGKANKDECQKMFDILQETKADKADLIDLLRRGDLDPLYNDLDQLRRLLDSVCSKTSLEMKELRSVSTTPPASSPTTTTIERTISPPKQDEELAARVTTLEGETRSLSRIKANQKDVDDLHLYMDTQFKDVRDRITEIPSRFQSLSPSSKTPTYEATDSGRGPGKLEGLTRPGSAGNDRRATIPEQIRPPSPKIEYTSSSPTKYTINNAKYRATAVLYDSDGNRTPASVTAARGVSFEDHVENRRRTAAGEEVIPSGYVKHQMP